MWGVATGMESERGSIPGGPGTRGQFGLYPSLRSGWSNPLRVFSSPLITEVLILEWRRGGDSNPRYSFLYAGLANLCFQPLSHLSVAVG